MRGWSHDAYIIAAMLAVDMQGSVAGPGDMQVVRVAHQHDDFAELMTALRALQIEVHRGRGMNTAVAAGGARGPLMIRGGRLPDDLLRAHRTAAHQHQQNRAAQRSKAIHAH
jgi:hypothetical protein